MGRSVQRPPRLFDALALPEGFRHAEDFISPAEERALLEHVAALRFNDMRMRGVTARRRVIQYGWKYSFESFRTSEGPPVPVFLLPLRVRAATFGSLQPEQLSEVLLTEYTPGATIGWHRDAAPFGVVIGISLLGPCRFRFRRGTTGAWETRELTLLPRSIYVLDGAARTEWQHGIPAVKALRYSITFRTLNGKSATRPPRGDASARAPE